jgi:hypothetical protein
MKKVIPFHGKSGFMLTMGGGGGGGGERETDRVIGIQVVN